MRLELTIPCLRGRCLDPFWLLTHACQKPARKQGRRSQSCPPSRSGFRHKVGGTERTRTVIGLVDNQVPRLSATVPNTVDCQLPIGPYREIGIVANRANRQSKSENQKSKMNWVGRRESNPHGPQSQCGALPIELRPTQKGDKRTSVTRHFPDVVTFSIRPELAGRVGFEPTHLLIENQAA